MWKKKIDPSDVVHYETLIEAPIALNSQSLDSVQFSYESGDFSNYWKFFKNNFYYNTSSYPYDSASINTYKGFGPQSIGTYYNKFNSSGSLINISQQYYGDGISPGTFILRDSYHSSSVNPSIKPILKDDGRGNIYSTNAYISQSSPEHLSSSINHIGNIFYDYGMIVLKETGSWSGSVSYMDIGKNNYNVSFKSQQILYTTEYNLRIEPQEFLHTTNVTSRAMIKGSDSSSLTSSPFYKNKITSSIQDGTGFAHFTTIGLYNMDIEEPLIVARMPRAIKSHTKVPITIRLKVDMII
tara:strand:+ start:132 stop:1022 length:891 start_codon:yes stop_codon:yes gene_type:complete